MPSVGFVIPVLPGRTDFDRSALGSRRRGERRAASGDACRHAVTTKKTVDVHGISRAAGVPIPELVLHHDSEV